MSKNLVVIALVGAAVVLMMQRKATAATPAPVSAVRPATTGKKAPSVNVNGDMWSRLMGGAWRLMADAQNPDGTQKFVTNLFGQPVTSDGKPIGGDDPIAAWMSMEGYSAPPSPGDNLLDSVLSLGSFKTDDILGWGD